MSATKTHSRNHFSLFAPTVKPAALRNLLRDNSTLAEIDEQVEADHQRLFKTADPVLRATLLHSFHRAKPPNTENYLRQFIKDFENDPAFTKTVARYRDYLTAYEAAEMQAAEASLNTSKQTNETLILTPQELDWQDLLETLKRCINNAATRNTLSWHLRHNENYYLAKLRTQWQQYEAKYSLIVLMNFTETLAYEVAQDREQTVIEKHVEAQQNLMQQKMDYTPTRLANQKEKLEQQKALNLAEINALIPELIEHSQEVIEFVQQPANQAVQQILDEAGVEIQRQQQMVASNPALFNLAVGSRHKNHALATLDKVDEARKMQAFGEIFAAESATISATLESEIILD